MENILNIADEMMLSISESEYYKNYILCKKKVMQDSELLAKMKEFKRLHVHIQCKIANGEPYDLNEEANVSRLYFNLLQNKTAKEFFESEAKLYKIIAEIFSKLGRQCSELLTEF